MKTTIAKVLSVLFVSFLYAQVQAQPPHVFTRYTTEDGISQKTVTSILQDHKGNLWFATWDGINKFDGYTFKNYKAHLGDLVGLTNNRIDYIAEDKFGYIWLLNYDSQVYRFNPRTGQIESIPYENYQASSLHVLSTGDVWISTRYEGLIHIETDPEHLTMTAGNFSQENRIPIIESINEIFLDSRNQQWVLTGNGMYMLPEDDRNPVAFFVENLKNNQKQPFFAALEREEEILFTSNKGRIWCYQKEEGKFSLLEVPTQSNLVTIDLLPGGRLLLGTEDDGFLVYHLDSKETDHYRTTTCKQLRSNKVNLVFIDSYHEVWIHFDEYGITHFDPETKEVTYHNMNEGGSDINIQSGVFIYEDIHKNLWIHPSGGRFAYYDRMQQKLIPFYNRQKQRKWDSSRMTAAFSDKQGNLWISTSTAGLEKATFIYNDFSIIPVNEQDSESLENEVRALFEDSAGRIWMGCKDAVIRVYNENMQLLGHLTSSGALSPLVKEPLGTAYSIIEDREGVIWIGTKGNGLMAVTPEPGRGYTVKTYKHDVDNMYSLSDDNIYCVSEDSQGKIWVATYGGGLNYLDQRKTGSPVFINHRNHLKNYPIEQCHRVRFITSDDENNIWVGTTAGILSFKDDFTDPEQIVFNHFTRIPGDMNSLSNNDVHSVFQTSCKELYVATFGGGLNKLLQSDKGKATFRSLTLEDGLASDILLSIAEDNQGNLWIATEEEICKLNPEKGSLENYTPKFFPVQFKINEGASLLTRSGKLLFHTNKGVLAFHPDSILKSDYIPQIVFSQFQLGDRTILPGDESEILAVDIDDTSKITLSHKNNGFSIQYAALDMKYPEDISYAYKLVGFEDNWNYVGKRRIATYTNLPKGEYQFVVKSANSDDVWTENERSIRIRVLPSFWETPWAILIYILALLTVIWLAVYILFTFYRLKDEVTMEQKLSDLKLRFFTNISHELRTPLTLIAGPIEHILNTATLSEEVHEQLHLVEKNTNRMLRLVNQILDFRKIQNHKMKMQVQQIELISFLRHTMESFQAMADEQQIEFVLENESASIRMWVDVDKLEKILFNLLSNAFKYTPQGKHIRVRVVEDEKEVLVSVRDQGIGIPENKQKTLFVRFESLVDRNLFNQPSSGIGLSLVKELVEMHKGVITIQSKQGEGSTFTFSLPKGKEHFEEETEFILTDYNLEQASVLPLSEQALQADDDSYAEINKSSMLIVEDNDELRFFLKTIFFKDFHIVEAKDGKEGLEKARGLNPDIIISDVMMPEMDGIEMVKELRSDVNTSHITIILLTAKSNMESKIEGIEKGADDYITKPFSAAYLRARIFSLLEQRKKLQAFYCASLVSATPESADEKESITVPALSPHDQLFMDQLAQLMETHMDNGSLVVEDLATGLGMSRSVFFKKLKSLIGLSPVEYIKEVRIRRAAELIEAGGNNMAEIAYMVGFNDPHYFSKCFKQIYAMTPSEYKEMKR